MEIRLSDLGKELYPERKKTIERVFADTKFNHCLGFTILRELKKNHNRCLLIFAVANMKKLALFIHKMEERTYENLSFLTGIIKKSLFFHDFSFILSISM